MEVDVADQLGSDGLDVRGKGGGLHLGEGPGSGVGLRGASAAGSLFYGDKHKISNNLNSWYFVRFCSLELHCNFFYLLSLIGSVSVVNLCVNFSRCLATVGTNTCNISLCLNHLW